MASSTAVAKAARLNRRMAALAAREGMSPTAPAPARFRLATWNINSLRARAASIDRFLERARPDVIGFQETKASTIAPDAASVLQRHGYNIAYTGNGAYNGVAIAASHAGLVDVDAKRWGPDQRRFTWWNHGLNYGRNLGMRIDVIAASRELVDRIDATWIDHIERGTDRPSDHACLVADFHVA